jgi:hypothetical protein
MMTAFLFLTALFVVAAGPGCELTLVHVKYGGGGDWYGNPSALGNLAAAVKQRTRIAICDKALDLDLTDDRLYDYPFLYLNGHGNIVFTDTEARRLREFLENGGFLLADDNYGMDLPFRREMKKVFPDLKWVELPFNHPIFHSFYEFPNGLPKIHEHDGGPPRGYALLLRDRVVVFYSLNTDLGDGWEDPDVHNDPPEVREAALKMGVNIIAWFLGYGK